MNLKSLWLCTVAMAVSFHLFAQKNTIGIWGGARYNIAYSMCPTSDGGYVMTGLTQRPDIDSNGDIIVIKLNTTADTDWVVRYGGPKLEGGNNVIQLSGGDILVSGHTQDFGAEDCDGYMMRMDLNGKVKWIKTFGGFADDIAMACAEEPNGNIVMAGITESFGNRDTSIKTRHAYFVKTNSNGDTIWTKTYATGGSEYAMGIQRLPSGGYMAVGWTTGYGAGEKDAWLMMLDANGNMWGYSLFKSDTGDSRFNAIKTLSDGNYIAVGNTSQPLNSSTDGIYAHSIGIIYKFSPAGIELWHKNIGNGQKGINLYDVDELPTGDLVFGGYEFNNDSSKAYILKTDMSGNIVNEFRYNEGMSVARGIGVQGNNSMLIAGQCRYTPPATGDIYWSLTDYTDFNVGGVEKSEFRLFPNPVISVSEIILPHAQAQGEATLEIFDAAGKLVHSSTTPAKALTINRREFVTGNYNYRVKCNDGTLFQGKFEVK